VTVTQKIILIALLAVGALCLIVGFTLMHHIGGFLRTVEEEAREQEKERADDAPESDAASSDRETGGEKIQ